MGNVNGALETHFIATMYIAKKIGLHNVLAGIDIGPCNVKESDFQDLH